MVVGLGRLRVDEGVPVDAVRTSPALRDGLCRAATGSATPKPSSRRAVGVGDVGGESALPSARRRAV